MNGMLYICAHDFVVQEALARAMLLYTEGHKGGGCHSVISGLGSAIPPICASSLFFLVAGHQTCGPSTKASTSAPPGTMRKQQRRGSGVSFRYHYGSRQHCVVCPCIRPLVCNSAAATLKALPSTGLEGTHRVGGHKMHHLPISMMLLGCLFCTASMQRYAFSLRCAIWPFPCAVCQSA